MAPVRPFLGVSTYAVNEETQRGFGLRASEGALVVSVSPGSPAEAAGLRRGDVITQIGSERVSSPDELSSAVRKHKPGDRVEVRWERGTEQRSATVTLSQTSGR